MTITSRSKGVLDSSGLPESARDYEKARETRKLLSASVPHGLAVQQHTTHGLAAQQLTQQSRQQVLLAMYT